MRDVTSTIATVARALSAKVLEAKQVLSSASLLVLAALFMTACSGGDGASALPPTIRVQPADLSVVSGDSASFRVDADGADSLDYQWRRNGVALPGANGKVYTQPFVSEEDNGAEFSVLVSDGRETVLSAAATLRVSSKPIAPTIVVPPADQSAFDGDLVTFTVTADGTAPLIYAWQRNGVTMPNEASATLTIRVSLADGGSKFRAIVSNKKGSVTSAEALLSVSAAPAAPTIALQPVSTSVIAPAAAMFSVGATGTAPLTYQWHRNGLPIAGANASAYHTPPTTVADSGSLFTVTVSNALGSIASRSATLTVEASAVAPTITTEPTNQTVSEGQSAVFTVVASGTAPLTYQWRRNNVNITGANGSIYTTPAVTVGADNGAQYSALVSNVAGQMATRVATLVVNAVAPAVTTQPTDQAVVEGQTATFFVIATGTSPVTYQWRRNGINVTGANTSSFTTPPTTVSGDHSAQYDVVISNSVGSVHSRVATLTVTMPSSYLAGLIATIPEGGWAKANLNLFSAAWPTGTDLPPPVPSGPYAVISAWSGFAWDTRRSNLILFGGGHANYVGNEVYLWRGSDGQWARGSLPSHVNLSTQLVTGNGAPQSAHTYQSNIYAPLVDRFVVFGGAIWSNGGSLFDANGRTGPWWWDPNKAHADRVGGQDGTGWEPTRLGSNAWQMRPYVPWVGLPSLGGLSFVYGTSAYREENGQDVIYLTMDQNGSGWPSLYRYQLGTPTTPDLFQRVGGSSGRSIMSSGAAAIDTRNGLFVRTALARLSEPYPAPGDLAVWRLANNNPTSPASNVDVAVQLFDEAGIPVDMNFASSIAYDSTNDQFVIWDSRDRGTVWITQVIFNMDGSISSTWTVRRVPSATTAQPMGNHNDGVLGKWKYASELGVFVALDSPSTAGDVWLYKPSARR